jgi:hypothetical protein
VDEGWPPIWPAGALKSAAASTVVAGGTERVVLRPNLLPENRAPRVAATLRVIAAREQGRRGLLADVGEEVAEPLIRGRLAASSHTGVFKCDQEGTEDVATFCLLRGSGREAPPAEDA